MRQLRATPCGRSVIDRCGLSGAANQKSCTRIIRRRRSLNRRIRTKFTMTEDDPTATKTPGQGIVMATTTAGKSIVLGDPTPWFGAPLIGDGAFNLQVAAGRWIVLSFLGAPTNPKVQQEVTELLRDAQLFHEDRIVFYGVFTAAPSDAAYYTALSSS